MTMFPVELTPHGRRLAGQPLLLRQALPASLCNRWRAPAGEAAPASRLAVSALDMAEVLQAVASSSLREPIEAALGPAPLCNLEQSWLRHGRPAHHWHQDGALRFDFLLHASPPGRPAPPDALLEMCTCWIALTPCGVDAPGLEWVAEATPALLWPAELTPQAVQSRYATEAFVRPALNAGDALVFDGTLLHRTHLTPGMDTQRTSLELRFFRADAWPARLADDRASAASLGCPIQLT